MDSEKISEASYKEAFGILSVAMNEAVRILMTAATQCEGLFMKAIEESQQDEL